MSVGEVSVSEMSMSGKAFVWQDGGKTSVGKIISVMFIDNKVVSKDQIGL
jgi:hypothetical protein